MNRLANSRIYLAGAMDRCADNGVGWRDLLKEQLVDLDIVWLDPCRKPTTLATESPETKLELNWSKERGDYPFVSQQMEVISAVDLRMVTISDATILNVDLDLHMCGSYEEFTLANQQSKPIIVHVEQGKNRCPSWIFGRIPHDMIFSHWEEVGAYLRHIARAPVIETHNRWYFFDLEEQV